MLLECLAGISFIAIFAIVIVYLIKLQSQLGQLFFQELQLIIQALFYLQYLLQLCRRFILQLSSQQPRLLCLRLARVRSRSSSRPASRLYIYYKLQPLNSSRQISIVLFLSNILLLLGSLKNLIIVLETQALRQDFILDIIV